MQKVTGKLFGCGKNVDYQVCGSDCTFLKHTDMVEIAVPSDYGNTWIDMEAGLKHSIGLTDSKQVLVWGSFRQGANEPSGDLTVPTVVKLPSDLVPSAIKSIHAGNSFSAISTHDGRLYTWGSNMHKNLVL